MDYQIVMLQQIIMWQDIINISYRRKAGLRFLRNRDYTFWLKMCNFASLKQT